MSELAAHQEVCTFECVYTGKDTRFTLSAPVRKTQDPEEFVVRIQRLIDPFVRLSKAARKELEATTKDSPAMAEFAARRYGLHPQDPEYQAKLDERYAMCKVELLMTALQREVERQKNETPEEPETFTFYLEVPSQWRYPPLEEAIVREELDFEVVTDCCDNPNILCSDDGNRQQECSNCKFSFNANHFRNDYDAMAWLKST